MLTTVTVSCETCVQPVTVDDVEEGTTPRAVCRDCQMSDTV